MLLCNFSLVGWFWPLMSALIYEQKDLEVISILYNAMNALFMGSF